MLLRAPEVGTVDKVKRYALYLLVIAGCGGLLFDFGGTIIGPALPYIGPVDENPGSLGLFTTAQVSHLSSAVVMCAALACLVAGWLTEKLGRKLMKNNDSRRIKRKIEEYT